MSSKNINICWFKRGLSFQTLGSPTPGALRYDRENHARGFRLANPEGARGQARCGIANHCGGRLVPDLIFQYHFLNEEMTLCQDLSP